MKLQSATFLNDSGKLFEVRRERGEDDVFTISYSSYVPGSGISEYDVATISKGRIKFEDGWKNDENVKRDVQAIRDFLKRSSTA